jgi:putative transposase
MPRKGHSPEQVLAKLRQVEVAVAGGKSVGHAVREIGVTGPHVLQMTCPPSNESS